MHSLKTRIIPGSDIEIEYWKNKLQGSEPLQLPSDFSKISSANNKYSSVYFSINENMNQQLEAICLQQNSSIFMLLLASFKTLLYRYCNQTDICVGSFVPVLQNKNFDNENGSFINALTLRSTINGELPFNTFLQDVQCTVKEALDNKHIPYKKVTEALMNKNSFKEITLFQTIFTFNKKDEQNFSDQEIKEICNQYLLQPDLLMIISEEENGLKGSFMYNAALYKEETVQRMVNHYNQLLVSIINKPDEKTGALKMLSSEEEYALITTFNNTTEPYPKSKTIVDLFEEQVLKMPDNTALIQGDNLITYQQLNEQSNRLANYLINRGIKPGDNIGLVVKRSFAMIISMYAIFKTGAAYVPIDPEYPVERQQYIFDQSSIKLILIDDDYPLMKKIPAEKFISINDNEALSKFSVENLKIKINSESLAYTIYTSGSTGKPKGVMIEHHSAVNLILWVNKEFNVGPNDRILFITSMCFDLSVYDIFGMLSAGGSIVIAKQEQVQDVNKLQQLLQDYQITFWDSVPTTMDYLVRELETSKKSYSQNSLKTIFLSGDWIPVDLPDRIKKYFTSANVISLGGATEGTVWSNYYPVKKVGSNWKSIPYGKPISNNFFYILNEQLQPVPIGVTGELYIGGVGVARGYANDKEKTDYSFVNDPFHNEAGGRMYRTGDVGRMLPDMNMEFVGRKDSQVKIRGFRVELGEIETVLNQSDLIRQGVVVAKNDKDGKKRLIGYVVANGNFDRDTVKKFLQTKLPEYMVPAAWVELENLPLNSNGKIDKKALPDAENNQQIKNNYKAPINDLEKSFVEIWQQVLGIEKIGTTDNFFELGGHSLIAVQIMAKIENNIHKKIPLAVFFKYPTIELQAASILQSGTDDSWKSLVPIKPSGSKMPLYIVHGEGLNVLNFNELAMYVDEEQPIFGLQALGLNGVQEPLDDIVKIATHYVNEIIENNPKGPYAIGGYSFGGYVAIEMRRQFEMLGKEVKMLALFDTNAYHSSESNKNITHEMPVIAKRQFSKFLWFSKLFIMRPKAMIKYQTEYVKKKISRTDALKQSEDSAFYSLVNKIKEKHYEGLRRYNLVPFNDKIYLFKSQTRIYFIDDQKYMGWNKYALKGVKVFDVQGDHKTMFMRPHVKEFARILQKALDNC